jgi:hypothetical protein
MGIKSNRKRTDGSVTHLDYHNKANRFTNGTEGDPYNWPEGRGGPRQWDAVSAVRNDYLYRQVDSREVKVQVPAPIPVLTPFDYLVFKCKDLMIEILRFVSRYDDNFLVTAPFETGTAFKHYWYMNVVFPKGIDAKVVHDCLGVLFRILQGIETHGPDGSESAQQGWDRRRRLLIGIVPPNRTTDALRDMARQIRGLATEDPPADTGHDPDLAAVDIDYLVFLVEDMRRDVVRMYDNLMGKKGEARAHAYKYMESYET